MKISLPRNREIILYLLFVVLAAAFWMFQAFNEEYEQTIVMPLEITNVPGNVVITSEIPTHVAVKVSDRGINLLPFVYGNSHLPTLSIDFREYQNTSGHIRLLTSELAMPLLERYSFNVLDFHPDTLDFYYNYGLCKRVPVRWQGTIQPAEGYALADIRLSRDSVLVYASQSVLDTITAAWLRPINRADVTDTLQIDIPVTAVRGAKFQPSTIRMQAYTDRMVEKTVQVPIEAINFPPQKRLQTFPAQATITCQVGMKMYREITAESFILVINYEDLVNNTTNHCHLSLKSIPLGVSQVKISPEDVEYIIEEE